MEKVESLAVAVVVVLSMLLSFGLLSLSLAIRARRVGRAAAYAALGFAVADLAILSTTLHSVRVMVVLSLASPAIAALVIAGLTLRRQRAEFSDRRGRTQGSP